MESTSAIRLRQPELTSVRQSRVNSGESGAPDAFEGLLRERPRALVDTSPLVATAVAVNGLQAIILDMPPADVDDGGVITGEIGPEGEMIEPQAEFDTLPAVDLPPEDTSPPVKDAVPPGPNGIPFDVPASSGMTIGPPATIDEDHGLPMPAVDADSETIASDLLIAPDEFLRPSLSGLVEQLLDPVLSK